MISGELVPELNLNCAVASDDSMCVSYAVESVDFEMFNDGYDDSVINLNVESVRKLRDYLDTWLAKQNNGDTNGTEN